MISSYIMMSKVKEKVIDRKKYFNTYNNNKNTKNIECNKDTHKNNTYDNN